MSVFTKTETVNREMMQNGEQVIVAEEVEVTYVETEIDGKPAAYSISDEDMDAIYEQVEAEIIEDELYEFVQKKADTQRDEIFDILSRSDALTQQLLERTQDEIRKYLDLVKPAIMEKCLTDVLPVHYGKVKPKEEEGGNDGT